MADFSEAYYEQIVGFDGVPRVRTIPWRLLCGDRGGDLLRICRLNLCNADDSRSLFHPSSGSFQIMERPALRQALLYGLQHRRCPVEPERAQIHLNHGPALRVHCLEADIDIKAGLVDVADRVVKLA